EAMTMADRIVVLRDGRVEQVGVPLDLYDTPANQFVAGFIGSPSMNFIDGTVRRDGAPSVVTPSGVMLPLPANAAVTEGQSVVWGVRPEHLDATGAGTLETSVDVIEPTGPETMLVKMLGDQ